MKSFTKTYYFNSKIENLFKALTDHDIFEEWSGSMAEINPVEGGRFSMWDDTINGRYVIVNKNKIIQEWKEETWEKFSFVTINLREVAGHTELVLTHEKIPPTSFITIRESWDEQFLGPLKEYVEEETD
ncbi:MAG: SRPBCC domain-containing protein [Bacteroidetes bacterium]|nr:SRPBCC domain-containing protein [Bacteroidota bacterium]